MGIGKGMEKRLLLGRSRIHTTTTLRSHGHHQKKYIPGGQEGALVAGRVAEAAAEAGCRDELGGVGDEEFAFCSGGTSRDDALGFRGLLLGRFGGCV